MGRIGHDYKTKARVTKDYNKTREIVVTHTCEWRVDRRGCVLLIDA